MYGILGEHDSDYETLRVIVRRLRGDMSIPVRGGGFGGCGNLLNGGARSLRALAETSANKFIICHDSDGKDPGSIRELVFKRVVKPSGLDGSCCIVVPVQEIEAWILSDIFVVTNIFKSWRPKPINNPESISKPCKYLESLSKQDKPRPRYDHATHNPQIAKYLDLNIVEARCPSFKSLADFVLERRVA